MIWPQLPGWLICAVTRHQPMLERDRNPLGYARPQALRWICRRCRKDLGETVLLYHPAPRNEA